MITPHWEHFEHEADMGVRGFGNSLAQCFEQTALAMTAIITDIELVEPRHRVQIECQESDPALLLVDWLNEIIYHIATDKMLFSQFEVSITGQGLQASIAGEKIDQHKHHPCVEIKGATYTQLAVYQQQDQWVAQCIVDV